MHGQEANEPKRESGIYYYAFSVINVMIWSYFSFRRSFKYPKAREKNRFSFLVRQYSAEAAILQAYEENCRFGTVRRNRLNWIFFSASRSIAANTFSGKIKSLYGLPSQHHKSRSLEPSKHEPHSPYLKAKILLHLLCKVARFSGIIQYPLWFLHCYCCSCSDIAIYGNGREKSTEIRAKSLNLHVNGNILSYIDMLGGFSFQFFFAISAFTWLFFAASPFFGCLFSLVH